MTHASDHQGRLPLAGLAWGMPAFTPEGLGDPHETYWTYYTDNGVRRVAPMVAQLGQYMGLEFRTDSREHMEEDINRPATEKLFHDPALEEVMRGAVVLGRAHGWRDTIRPEPTSYAFSEGILGYRGATSHDTVSDYPAGRLSHITKAASTLFMIDGVPSSSSQVFFDIEIDGDDHSTFYEYWFVNDQHHWGATIDFGRHAELMNAVFADGHAQSVHVGKSTDVRIDNLKEVYVLY